MTSYTTNAAYPYPSATDQLVDYPTTAGTFAGFLDNLPNRNRIINGAFDVWQRGTSFAAIADGTYTADRWRYSQTGAGGTHAVTQVAQPTGSTLIGGMNPRFYLRLNNTVLGTATAQIIGQRVEDVRTLAGQECTLSAWIKGTATGITAKAVQNFGTGGTPSSAVTTTLGTATPTTSWVRLHVHFTMPNLSTKTIGTNENSFVEIQFDCTTSLGTLDLWGVQLEQNTTQTAFELESIQQTLDKCHRYYERYAYEGYFPQTSVYVDVVNRVEIIIFYKQKRTFPTMSVSSATHFTFESPIAAGNQVGVANFAALVGTGIRGTNVFCDVAAWTIGRPAYGYISNAAGSIDFSAEL